MESSIVSHPIERTDSKTKEHIAEVQKNMSLIIDELKKRASNHDRSKLEEPERSGFEAMDAYCSAHPSAAQYGSEAYFEKLQKFNWVMDHHYKHNRHHPEYYSNFYSEMDVIDIIELICDWWSRKEFKDFREAAELVEQQSKRYNFPPILTSIILNTVNRFLAVGDFPQEDEPLGVFLIRNVRF